MSKMTVFPPPGDDCATAAPCDPDALGAPPEPAAPGSGCKPVAVFPMWSDTMRSYLRQQIAEAANDEERADAVRLAQRLARA